MKIKKFQSALLDPPGRYTGNDFLLKGGLIVVQLHQNHHKKSLFPVHRVAIFDRTIRIISHDSV